MMSARFSNFSRLPPEIRDMVWAYALPEARVLEVLDAPHCSLKTPADAGLMFADQFHEPPPYLTAVCQESRAFVFHRYKAVTFSGLTKFLDPARDTILLESYLLTRRLLRVLGLLARIPSIRNHIRHLALGTSYGINTGILHSMISGKMSKRRMKIFMGKLSRFPRLKKLFFVVYQDFQPKYPEISALSWSYQISIIYRDVLLRDDAKADVTYHWQCSCQQNGLQNYYYEEDQDRNTILQLSHCFDDTDAGWPDRRPTRHDWKKFQRRFSKAMSVARSKTSDKERAPAWPLITIEGSNIVWKSPRRGITSFDNQTGTTRMTGSLLSMG